MGKENDAPLIERVRHSDREAFRLLFEKFQPILFRNVLYNVQDADTAHDIVQETFVRVWDHRASLKPDLPFLGYLFRIGRNLILDAGKHGEVRRKFEADNPQALQPGEENPEESLHAKMLEERLAEVVRTELPAKCREIFLLSRVEGMSNKEISGILEISVKTVENQITRGLKILRKHLRAFTDYEDKSR